MTEKTPENPKRLVEIEIEIEAEKQLMELFLGNSNKAVIIEVEYGSSERVNFNTIELKLNDDIKKNFKTPMIRELKKSMESFKKC